MFFWYQAGGTGRGDLVSVKGEFPWAFLLSLTFLHVYFGCSAL